MQRKRNDKPIRKTQIDLYHIYVYDRRGKNVQQDRPDTCPPQILNTQKCPRDPPLRGQNKTTLPITKKSY